jgi:PAP2 superfamily
VRLSWGEADQTRCVPVANRPASRAPAGAGPPAPPAAAPPPEPASPAPPEPAARACPSGGQRGPRRWHPVAAARSLASRRPALRYLQIIPVGLALWGLDAVDKFRPGAAVAGLEHAVTINAISRQLGGGFADQMNDWLAAHHAAAVVAAWYYIVLQGAVTAIIGLLLIWRRVPSFRLHRDALISCNVIGLVVFWLYPVAPPRMLPGYHDVTAAAVPLFSGLLESKAADQFASLPSLHVTWALWAAVAVAALVKRPALRAAVWIYPALTVLDVLATANHYWLDAITAIGVLALAYAIAASLGLARAALIPARPWSRPRPVISAGPASRVCLVSCSPAGPNGHAEPSPGQDGRSPGHRRTGWPASAPGHDRGSRSRPSS